jgi:hypothetical protein
MFQPEQDLLNQQTDILKNKLINEEQEERVEKMNKINYGDKPSKSLTTEEKKQRQNEAKKLRARALVLLEEGQLAEYVDIVDYLDENNLIGKKAKEKLIDLYQLRIDAENTQLDFKEKANKIADLTLEGNRLMQIVEKEMERKKKEQAPEIQAPEIQAPEIQEPEIQAPEIQKPRLFKVVKEFKSDKEKRIREEIALDETASGLTKSILKQARRQVLLEETGSRGNIPLKIVEQFTEDPFRVELTKEEQKRMSTAIRNKNKMERRDAIKKRIMSEKDDMLKRENEIVMGTEKGKKIKAGKTDLSKFFSAYDKSTKDKIPFDRAIANQIKQLGREVISKGEEFPEITEDSLSEIWDNFMTSEQQKNFIQPRTPEEAFEIVDLIDKFNRTAQLVPENMEGNENMSKEDRQRLFHHLLYTSGKSKKEVEREAQNNFENYGKMSGGINAGLQTKTTKQENDFKADIAPIYQDYNQILDAKINDNAMSRELFKGVDPNDLVDAGISPELMDEYFERLNALENAQNNAEINGALNNIEILSGGNRDSLFGVQDQASTRTALRGEYNPDYPDNLQYNPSGLERGRNAQAIDEVKEEELNLRDREATGRTIGLSVGILGNAFRGIFGKDDVINARGKESILDDINQNIRLLGKRSMYGTDKKDFDDDYEGIDMNKRVASFAEYSKQRPYGNKNPSMMEQETKENEMDDIAKAMMFNKGIGGAVGSTIPQLREQEFGYKLANRKTAHNGVAFIRGGNRTAAMIENEFLP